MKIWIINHYAYAPFHHGGTRHYMLAKKLKKAGHEVLIVSTSFFHKSFTETRLEKGQKFLLEEIDGIPFLWLRTPPYKGSGIKRIINMISFACSVFSQRGMKNLENPDVIYASSPDLFCGLGSWLLARKKKVPFVFEIRDLWPQTFIDLGHAKPESLFIRVLMWIQNTLYKNANHVITTLPSSLEYIRQNGGAKQKITWITNGIDVDTLPEIKDQRQHFDTMVAMHAGVHALSTGLETTLEAARILKEKGYEDKIEIAFVGDGPEKEKHREFVKTNGLKNVVLHDPVEKSKIFEKLETADVFLLPRKPSPIHRWGISPHKLADYFAAKRPVIFSVDSPWNPIKEAGAGMTATPGSADSMADTLIKMYHTTFEQRKEMAENGYDFLLKELNMDVLGKRLENVLLDAVKNF